MKNVISHIALATAISVIFPAGVAFAQNADSDAPQEQSGGLEEIIVTARKQSENLQSTPVTITAFTETALQNRGITNNADIGNFTPNVVFDTSSTFSGVDTFQGFIRGVGQADFALNTDPGVGLYVDGVYYARAPGSVIDLMDIERVEVLKGPQGTLFGRNSIGGAVSIVTSRPGDTFSAKGEITVGQRNRFEAKGALNLPLADNLKSSIAFRIGQRDGYQKRIPFGGTTALGSSAAPGTAIPLDQLLVSDNNNGGDLGAKSGYSLRGKLLWEASDGLEVTLAGDYTANRDAANPTTLLEVDPNFALGGLYNACIAGVGAVEPLCRTTNFLPFGANASGTRPDLQYTSQFITGDIDKSYASGANFANIDNWGISGTVDLDVTDWLKLKSITAFRKLNSTFGLDIDGSPLVVDQTSFILKTEQISQEFQFNLKPTDRFNLTTGAYYFKENGFQSDNVPIAGGLIQAAGGFDHDTKTVAVFGEGNYEVLDGFSLLFGIRYTDEEKTLSLNQQNLNTAFATLGLNLADLPRPSDPTYLAQAAPFRAKFSNVSIRTGANWKISNNLFTYLTFSQGFKSGGFTTRLTTYFSPALIAAANPNDPTVLRKLDFGEETSNNFELGFKSQLLDNRIRLNAAVFHNKYKNIQIVLQRGVSPSNENVAEARIQGLEVELEALPTDWLSLNASFGYLDAKYTAIDPAAAALLINRFGQTITAATKLQNTPEITASLAANVKLSSALSVNVNGSYTSRVENDVFNTSLLSQPGYVLANASVLYRHPSDGWNVRLGVNNLTNKRYIVSGFEAGSLPFTNGSYNRPREWYLTVGIKM